MQLRFVHPPRTGGSSIRRSWVLDPLEYDGHAFPGELRGDTWYYGFTRNPWDRVVSLWHYPTTRVPFKDFVMGGLTPNNWGKPHEMMASPTARWLDGVQFVGRFETRERDLFELSLMLNREPPRMHVGPTVRGPYQEYYDDESRQRVAELYADDIRAFGYAF